MRVIGTDILNTFMRKHPDCNGWLRSWLAETRKSQWPAPQYVKDRYKSATVLDGSKVIFNVKGNRYRMEVEISFKHQIVIVKRIGTHAEYNRWQM